jgi:hypothetical protein
MTSIPVDFLGENMVRRAAPYRKRTREWILTELGAGSVSDRRIRDPIKTWLSAPEFIFLEFGSKKWTNPEGLRRIS